MENAESRCTEKTRQYYGENKGAPLVSWLNSAEDKNFPAIEEAKARVAIILDQVAEITARGAEDEKRAALAAKINDSLRECAMVPQVWIVAGEDRPVLDMVPVPGPRRDEGWAVVYLTDLWRAGLIENLRRCRNCRKFLYKRFVSQEFCGGSDRCRVAFYKRSREFKDKRNKKLRENYARFYSSTRKSDRAAGGNKPKATT